MAEKDWTDSLDELATYESIPKLREGYVKSPFGYPGGKSRSVKQIVEILPVRERYIESCGGGGSILLARNECPFEVFNDRHSGVTAFFRVIKNSESRSKLLERLQPWICSREEYTWCADTWRDCNDDIERAARWYYMVRTSFGALGRNFGRSTSPPNIIAEKLESSIPLITKAGKRLQKVLIENMDCFQLHDDFDHPDSVFYIDPPYVGTPAGLYQFIWPDDMHRRLCAQIMGMKSYVALSGFKNPIYESYPWDDIHTWEVVSTVSSRDDQKRSKQIECLYVKEAS